MPTWIREHFDTAEHTRNTISVGAVVASAISLVLFLIVAFLVH